MLENELMALKWAIMGAKGLGIKNQFIENINQQLSIWKPKCEKLFYNRIWLLLFWIYCIFPSQGPHINLYYLPSTLPRSLDVFFSKKLPFLDIFWSKFLLKNIFYLTTRCVVASPWLTLRGVCPSLLRHCILLVQIKIRGRKLSFLWQVFLASLPINSLHASA